MSALRFVGAVTFLTSVMTFTQSFVFLKLSCLGLFVVTHLLDSQRTSRLKFSPAILLFYCLVGIGGILWSFVGLVNGGEARGVVDALRLYVVWSAAYVVILTLLRNDDGIRMLHVSLCLSAILITGINVLGLLDFLAQTSYISLSIREELDMFAGIGDGYVKITSQNIGSLLFIVPYLMAARFKKDMREWYPSLTKVALVLGLVMVVISGRRAVWLCVAFAPLLIAMLALVSGGLRDFKYGRKLLFGSIAAVLAVAVFAGVALRDGLVGSASVDYLTSAFAETDERSIQQDYLVETFLDYPVMGTGFGVYGGYLRNQERPWIYELTYFQMMFNFGIVGLLYWLAIAALYLSIALRAIREGYEESGPVFCMMVGLASLIIGAYSNPYFGSFDYLLYVGMLPYAASYASGISWRI